MKRYIRGGVSPVTQYAAVVYYNDMPIGYLSSKQVPLCLYVQTDPGDVTKAHGIRLSSSERSINSVIRYYSNDRFTTLYILHNKNIIAEYTNIQKPMRYYVARGIIEDLFTEADRIQMDGLIEIKAIPADEDVEFVDATSSTFGVDRRPSLLDSIEYLRDILELEGPTHFVQTLFKQHDPEEIESQGILSYLYEYPTYAASLMEWGDKYDIWNDCNIASEVEDTIREIAASVDILDVIRSQENEILQWINKHCGVADKNTIISNLHSLIYDLLRAFNIPSIYVDIVQEYCIDLINRSK